MVRPNQDAIETFMTITGVSEVVAVQKLEEHGGDLNDAVNAHFIEGDRNTIRAASVAPSQDDLMDIDDPVNIERHRPTLPSFSFSRGLNPFSLLDPIFGSSILNSGSKTANQAPFVSHPTERREIPIEVKDGNGPSNHSSHAPRIEDVSNTTNDHGSEIHGTVIVNDEDDENIAPASTVPVTRQLDGSNDRSSKPSAPEVLDFPEYSNDIEDEMIRAAIEASKRELGQNHGSGNFGSQKGQLHSEDPELAQAVSMSLKSVEKEEASSKQDVEVEASKRGASNVAHMNQLGKCTSSNRSNIRLEAGSSSIHEEAEDVKEQPLVRHRTRQKASGSVGAAGRGIRGIDTRSPFGPAPRTIESRLENNGDVFHSNEWGGISSEEHDEAVMLEAAMFGGVPDTSGYYGYGPHQFMQSGVDGNMGPLSRRTPHPPSPDLAAQRLLREQQDDEYFASLCADKEREMKVKEEEHAARQAALEEQKREEEESHRRLMEKQEYEKQIEVKHASLPQEPALDDENAVTLLVRMPDGSRHGRRFLKSDKLQLLFNFIDVGRAVKPGAYRLVRPFPRRAFGHEEKGSTLGELGLTSKQEALYLELI